MGGMPEWGCKNESFHMKNFAYTVFLFQTNTVVKSRTLVHSAVEISWLENLHRLENFGNNLSPNIVHG